MALRFIRPALSRNALRAFFAQGNIFIALHYRVILRRFTGKNPRDREKPYGSLAVAERATREILSLPMFTGLKEELQRQVVGDKRIFSNGVTGAEPSDADLLIPHYRHIFGNY